MNPFQDERNRRALLILGIAFVLYLGVSQVLAVYDRLQAVSEGILQKEDQLRRYRRALNRTGRYEELIVDAQRQIDAARSRLMSTSNPALASSELQSRVEETARAFEINFSQRSISAMRKKDDLVSEVGMTLTFEASPSQLVGFLGELRRAPKALSVSVLQITPLQIVHEMVDGLELNKRARVALTVTALLDNDAAPAGD